MKYINILGKDFKYKKDAIKYYKERRSLFVKPKEDNLIKLDEITPIKKSQIDYLYDYYPTDDEKYLERKVKNKKPIGWYMAFPAKDTNGSYQKSLAFRLNYEDKEKLHNGIETVRFKSLFKCFGSTDQNPLTLLKTAARWEIGYQIEKFKENNQLICSKCNLQYEWNDIQAHHINSFDDILFEWRDNVVPDEKDFIEYVRVKYSAKFKDRELAKNWCDFHLNVAQLKLFCKSCHLKEHHGS